MICRQYDEAVCRLPYQTPPPASTGEPIGRKHYKTTSLNVYCYWLEWISHSLYHQPQWSLAGVSLIQWCDAWTEISADYAGQYESWQDVQTSASVESSQNVWELFWSRLDAPLSAQILQINRSTNECGSASFITLSPSVFSSLLYPAQSVWQVFSHDWEVDSIWLVIRERKWQNRRFALIMFTRFVTF